MTHPNFQTNGASLEDCHTNFFALTELSGIKWRKLVWTEGGRHGGGVGGHGGPMSSEPLEDPILASFARCLAADILCVWRRVSTPRQAEMFEFGPPPPAPPPPLSLASSKELWVFWYGEEPELNDLIAPELNMSDCEQGSWESGLSYECRSLLFKALHNLIERCLLSRDFIRLGKWFVQPYDGPKKADSISTHLSISFAFFVHGDSSVCASIDARQHPPVRRLTRNHLQQAQASNLGLKVILAPFGLAGTLTGQSYKSSDVTTRMLDEWSQFYPLDKSSSLSDSNVVEVIVGGVKLRYPSCYVLVTDLDENANLAAVAAAAAAAAGGQATPIAPQANNNGMIPSPGGGKTSGSASPILIQTPPPSPIQINSRVPQPGPYSVSLEHLNSMSRDHTSATLLPERVWQDCMVTGSGGEPAIGNWAFVEPTRKINCTCSKCRKLVGGGNSSLALMVGAVAAGGSTSTTKWLGGGGPARPPKMGGTRIRGVPFHRRSLDTTRCSGSYTPQGGPPSYPRTQESMAIPSVGSPPSVAPSPLPNPHSQPASVPPGDQIMPTLSPHPPPTSPGEKTSNTPDQPKSEEPNPNPSDSSSTLNTSTTTQAEQSNQKSVEPQATPANPTGGAIAPPSAPPFPALKRPILNSREYEVALGEEEQTLEMLYDFTSLEAWLNHPVKKFKGDPIKESETRRMYGAKMDIYSIYTGVSETTIKQDIKLEPNAEGVGGPIPMPHPHGVKRPGDPYDFDEEGAVSACAIDGFKRGNGAVPGGGTPPLAPVIKEEPKDIKKVTDNLFTSEGLQPSIKDLEQIFDNSDYTSSDEAMQVQTPPTSNHHDDKRMSSHGGGGCPNTGILRPEELSKMFPTPPSLEHNPIASPCGQLDLPPPDFTDISIVRIKQEIYPNMGSPQEENIDDWSYVFRPPIICRIVGSSKYAPLTNLPSQTLPAVTVPTNCVYKPSWLQHAEKAAAAAAQQQQQSAQESKAPAAPPTAPAPPTVAQPNLASPFPASPMQIAQQQQQHANSFRPPPPPYELPSPANSTASSYMNKNLNSVEPVATPSAQQRIPEANSLILNILLTDTAFNIFRDHNFDSCTLCVCNAAGKVVGNIRGADAGIYLLNTASDKVHASARSSSPFPPPYGSMLSPGLGNAALGCLEEDSIRCSCGFSAVVNRRLAYGSGLFYEDENEITGIAEDPGDKKKPSLVSFLMTASNGVKLDPGVDREQLDLLPHSLLELMREQCVFIPSTANALCRAARYHHVRTQPKPCTTINDLEFSDSNEVTVIALEQSKWVDALSMCKMEELSSKTDKNVMTVHKWPFLRAGGPQCNQDIVRVMKSLQPLLQEAIQKKCQTRLWEAPSAVKGPLTWRQFHRLAGRGTDDRCEPQPIPSVIVGHDKDWLSLSPYALQHWESLLLEPYSYARDVAYIVVAPDNDAILPRVRTFFKELGTAYEMCKLGRHSPITKVLRDGILRVGKTAKTKIGNEPVEEWFTMLGDSETTDMLKLYAQVCKHHLAAHLQQVPLDKSLLDPPADSQDKTAAPSPMPPPSTPDGSGQTTPTGLGQALTPDKAPSTPKSEQDADGLKESSTPSSGSGPNDSSHDDDDREAPSVVVYLVEPFSLGSDQPELQRLACLALLRCFQSVVTSIPENLRNNISVQIISLESIVELNKSRDRSRHSDHMRALALNIFSQCRRLLVHSNNVKSLTGFGTAAMADLFLKSKDEKNRAPYKLYTPPYILAPMREKVEASESFGKGSTDQASVLYLNYCLSEDQSWLLAVATDERGEIFETITINIDIPNRSRRKKASARRTGLEKLMNFILGVMSQSVRPWRLVVGRLGRIGHGELKGWSWLLSKKNLLKASIHLKDLCNQCSIMYPNSVPCILSACLVSLEPDSVLRLMPDQFTPDERFSQASVNSQLSTPQDVSCTHILVFPTSATTQSSQTAFQEQHITPELGDDELLRALHDDMAEGIEGMNDFTDIFNWTEPGAGGGQSPTGSQHREESGPGSPTCGMNTGRQGSPFNMGCVNSKMNEPTEDVGTVLQQPLALGYLVSTAPTGRMPKWFWASCPHLEGYCPAFLKNALHLHSPNVQQSTDDLFQQAAVTSHPLDSQYTTDVLRYVLEGYNALSWLALDSNTRDRLSCLPVHMQVLVQLYHTAAALL